MAYNNIYQQYGLQPNAALDIPAFQNLLQQQFGTQSGNTNANYQQIPQQQQQQAHHQQQNVLNQFVVQQQQQQQPQQHFQAQDIFSQQQQQSQQPTQTVSQHQTRRATRLSAHQQQEQQQLQQQQQQQQLLLQQQQQQLLQQQQEAQRQQQAAAAAAQQAEAAAAAAAKNKRSRGGKSMQNSATQPAPAPIPTPVARPAATSSQKTPAKVIPPDTALAVAQQQIANIPADKVEKNRTHSHYKTKLTTDPVALAQDIQTFPNRMVENLPTTRQRGGGGSQSTSTAKKRRRGAKKRDESDSDSDYAAPPGGGGGDASPSGGESDHASFSSHNKGPSNYKLGGTYSYRCTNSNVGLKRDSRPFYQLCFEYFTQVPVPDGFQMEKTSSRGSKRVRIYMQCNACARKLFCDTTDASTLQAHLERYHYVLFLELKRRRYPEWMPPAGAADKLVDKNLSPLEVMEEHFDVDELKNDNENNIHTLRAAFGVEKVDGLVHRATCRICSQSIFILNKRITMLKEHLQRVHTEAYIKWLYEGVTLRFSAQEAERMMGRLALGDIFWAWVDEIPLSPYEQMEKNSVVGGSQCLPWAKYKCHACKEILYFHEGDGYRLANHFMRNHATEHALGITEQVKINHLKTILVAERSERKFFNSGWQQIFTLFYEGTTIREHDERNLGAGGVVMYTEPADLIRKNPCYNTVRVRLLDLCQCRICGLVTNTFSLKNANYAQEHIMEDHAALQSYLVNWFGSCDPRLIVVQLERLLCAQQFPLADYADAVNDAKLGWLDVIKGHFEIDEAAAAAASQRQLLSQSSSSADPDNNNTAGTVRCKHCSTDVPWLNNSLYYLAQHLKLKHFKEYMSTATSMLSRQKQHQIVLSVRKPAPPQVKKEGADSEAPAESAETTQARKLLFEPPLSIGMVDSFDAAWKFMDSRLTLPIDDVSFDPVDNDQLRINLSDILCRFFDGLPRAGNPGAGGGAGGDQPSLPTNASAAQLLQLRRAAAMANNTNNVLSNSLTTVCTICSKTIVCESLAYANNMLTRHLRFDHPTLCAELDIPPLNQGANAGRVDADSRAVIRFAQSEEKAVSAELSGSAAKLVEVVSSEQRYTWFDVLLRYFHQLQSTVFSGVKKNAPVATKGGKSTKSEEESSGPAVVSLFDADYANQYLKLECKLCDEKLFFTTCDRQHDIDLLQRHFIDNHIKLFDKLVTIRRDHTKTLTVKQVIMRRALRHDIIRTDESKMLVEGGVNEAIKKYLEGQIDSWATVLWMFYKIETEAVKYVTIKLEEDLPESGSGPVGSAPTTKRALTDREIRNIAYEANDLDDENAAPHASRNAHGEENDVNIEPSSKVTCRMCPFSFKFHRHSPRANDKNLMNLRKHLWRNHNPLYKHLQRIVPFEMPLINSEYWRRRKNPGDEELHLSDTRVIRRKKGKLMTASSTTLRQCATFFSDSESDSSEDERRKAPFRASAVVPIGAQRAAVARSAPLVQLFLHERAKWKHIILNLFSVDSKCKVNTSGPASSAMIVPKNERFNYIRLSNSKFLVCSFCQRQVNVVNMGEAKEAKNHLTEFHNDFYNDLVRLKTHLEDNMLRKKKQLYDNKDSEFVKAKNKQLDAEIERMPNIVNMCDLRLIPFEKDLLKSESLQTHIAHQLRPDVIKRGDVAESVRWFFTFEPALTPQELVPPPPKEAKREEKTLMATRREKTKSSQEAEKTSTETTPANVETTPTVVEATPTVEGGATPAVAENQAASEETAAPAAAVDANEPIRPEAIFGESSSSASSIQPAAAAAAVVAEQLDVPSSSGMESAGTALSATQQQLTAAPEEDEPEVLDVIPAPPPTELIVHPIHRTATCRVCEAVLEQCDSQTLVNHLQHNHWSLTDQILHVIHDRIEKIGEREKLLKQEKAQQDYLRQVEERKRVQEGRKKMMDDIDARRRQALQKKKNHFGSAQSSKTGAGLFQKPQQHSSQSVSKVSFNIHQNSSSSSATGQRKSYGGLVSSSGGSLFGTKPTVSTQQQQQKRLSFVTTNGQKKKSGSADSAAAAKRSHKKKPEKSVEDNKKSTTPAAPARRSESPPIEWNITTRKKKIDFGRTEREWDSLLEEAEREHEGGDNKKSAKTARKFISGGEEEGVATGAAAETNDDNAVDFVFGGGANSSSQNDAMEVDGEATAATTKESESEKHAEPSSSDLARALDQLNDDQDDDPDFGADDDAVTNGGDDDSDYEGGGKSARNRKRTKLHNGSSSFNNGGASESHSSSQPSKATTSTATAFRMQNELQKLLDDQKPSPQKPKKPPVPKVAPASQPTTTAQKASSFFGVPKTLPSTQQQQRPAQHVKLNVMTRIVPPPANKIISFGVTAMQLQQKKAAKVAAAARAPPPPASQKLSFGGTSQPQQSSNLSAKLKAHQSKVSSGFLSGGGLKVHQQQATAKNQQVKNGQAKKNATNRVKFYPEKGNDGNADEAPQEKSNYFMPVESESDDFSLRPAAGTTLSPPPTQSPMEEAEEEENAGNAQPKWPIFDDDDDAYDNRGGGGLGEGDDEVGGDDDWTKKTTFGEHGEEEEQGVAENEGVTEEEGVAEREPTPPVEPEQEQPQNGDEEDEGPPRKKMGRPLGSTKQPTAAKKIVHKTFDDAVAAVATRPRGRPRKHTTTTKSGSQPDSPGTPPYAPAAADTPTPAHNEEEVDDKDEVRREIAARSSSLALAPAANPKVGKKSVKRSVVLVSYRCLPAADDASESERSGKPADNVTTLTLPNKADDAHQTEGLLELRSVLDEEAQPLDKIGRRYMVPVDALSAMERLFVLGFVLKKQTLANGFMLCNLVAEEEAGGVAEQDRVKREQD